MSRFRQAEAPIDYDDLNDLLDNVLEYDLDMNSGGAGYSSPTPTQRYSAMPPMQQSYTARDAGPYQAQQQQYSEDDFAYEGDYIDEELLASMPMPMDTHVQSESSRWAPRHGPSQAQTQTRYELPPIRSSQSLQGELPLVPVPNTLADGSVASRTMDRPTQPVQESQNGHVAPPGRRIPLQPVSSLPDMYRTLFPFGVFNAVQSECFDTVMNTNHNMVISAPTSSGKTVLFELAMVKLLMSRSTKPNGPSCVYVAPTKALCTEKFKEWSKKFAPIGAKCVEFTGDTSLNSRQAFKEAKEATIIITTPEKWDSLTRNWHEIDFLAEIRLFMVDEVHILHEPRGATLEVCVSRMKTRANPRFVMVSATVPNIEDIASWIRYGDPPHPTRVFSFDETYRPCKITRKVYGFPRKNQNDFQFLASLDNQLFPLVERHAQNKPTVVFCPTRKSVWTAAEKIAAGYRKLMDEKKTLPWRITGRKHVEFENKQLTALYASGVSVHHAGLSVSDRTLVENLFATKQIMVVVSTSTLAVGVNMPAHTVVIHGTRHWAGSWEEYSDLDIMQMMGRAGRPQFDKEGVAVILCEQSNVARYDDLLAGLTVLESTLHQHLLEHLASEITLGTIDSLDSAKKWLKNSFFFQRIQNNPAHYASLATSATSGDQTWQERADEIVEDAMGQLEKAELVKYEDRKKGGGKAVAITELGEIMSKYYVRFPTMKLITAIEDQSSMKGLLLAISQMEELSETVRLRPEEKKGYTELKQHPDIRYAPKKIEKTADKVFLLLQAVLGGISLNGKEWKALGQPAMEALGLFRHASRISHAIVDVGVVQRLGGQVKFGMELVRSFNAKAWDDRPVALKQLPHIGEKSFKVLVANGIASVDAIRSAKPHRLEALLNRKPPFGQEIIAAAFDMPDYKLRVTEDEVQSNGGHDPVSITLSISVSLRQKDDESGGGGVKAKKLKGLGMTCLLTVTSDNCFIDFRRIPTRSLLQLKSFSLEISLSKPSQSVIVCVHPENFAGMGLSRIYKPALAPSEFPTLDTRPAPELSVKDEAMQNGDFMDPSLWEISDDERELIEGKAPATPIPPVVQNASKAARKDAQISASVSEPTGQTITRKTLGPSSKEQEGAPLKLANGNYRCNHACKDKTACRHLCCHEGLPKPPPKKASTNTNQASVANHMTKIKPGKPAKDKAAASAKRLADSLDQLHDATTTNPKNSQTGARKRLKIDPDQDVDRLERNAAELLARYGEGAASPRMPDRNDSDGSEEPVSPSTLLASSRLLAPILTIDVASDDDQERSPRIRPSAKGRTGKFSARQPDRQSPSLPSPAKGGTLTYLSSTYAPADELENVSMNYTYDDDDDAAATPAFGPTSPPLFLATPTPPLITDRATSSAKTFAPANPYHSSTSLDAASLSARPVTGSGKRAPVSHPDDRLAQSSASTKVDYSASTLLSASSYSQRNAGTSSTSGISWTSNGLLDVPAGASGNREQAASEMRVEQESREERIQREIDEDAMELERYIMESCEIIG